LVSTASGHVRVAVNYEHHSEPAGSVNCRVGLAAEYLYTAKGRLSVQGLAFNYLSSAELSSDPLSCTRDFTGVISF